MRAVKNMGGGTSVYLTKDDTLKQVPQSHRDIITPAIEQAFLNPQAYFGQIAKQCEFPNMKKWLKLLAKGNRWALVLEEAFMMDRVTRASFYWAAKNVVGAFISLPVEGPSHELPAFAHYYSLVDVVHWEPSGIACAGGLFGARDHIPLSRYGMAPRHKSFPADKTMNWGSSLCGDMLVYSRGGTAGYLSHENSKAYELGSIEEGIEFVFGELLAGRTPEFDYSRKSQ